jgi:hypothetical protein
MFMSWVSNYVRILQTKTTKTVLKAAKLPSEVDSYSARPQTHQFKQNGIPLYGYPCNAFILSATRTSNDF